MQEREQLCSGINYSSFLTKEPSFTRPSVQAVIVMYVFALVHVSLKGKYKFSRYFCKWVPQPSPSGEFRFLLISKLGKASPNKQTENNGRSCRNNEATVFFTLHRMYLPWLRRAWRSPCHCLPWQGSLSKTSTSLLLPLGPAEISEISWSSGVFGIYNLNILPHTHCCCVSDEQQPVSCSLLHPRLTMCQIPGIIRWQCTHQITLRTTGTSPASSHTQAAELGRSCLCWARNPITLKTKTNLKVTSRSFYFVTNKTNHRVNYKAAGNCTLISKTSLDTMCITA